jgi:hypothetical protein
MSDDDEQLLRGRLKADIIAGKYFCVGRSSM